ncbi:MAG: DUF2231 domain-containing protein [Chthonomonadales bacterium]|nr:DUF2231 domain-containing protein [Chthonomonadales bacterium]
MESRAKLVGHGIHPMLIVFPLGLLSISVVWDIVYLSTGEGAWAFMAFWCIAAGVIGGLLAAIFGVWDWLAIPSGTRARAVGLWHGTGNVVVVVLFIVSWLLRLGNPSVTPVSGFVLSCIGLALALVTGWLGGELVERLGVGVGQGANLNAPSSLASAAPPAAVNAPPGLHQGS